MWIASSEKAFHMHILQQVFKACISPKGIKHLTAFAQGTK